MQESNALEIKFIGWIAVKIKKSLKKFVNQIKYAKMENAKRQLNKKIQENVEDVDGMKHVEKENVVLH